MSCGKKAIWFDFGGVLTPPVPVTVAAFCQRVGAPPEVLVTAMTMVAKKHGTDDLMEPLDTPLVSEEVWAREMEAIVRERFGLSIDLSDFGGKWFNDRDPNAELVDYMASLRARGYFVGMLSNMVPSWDAHWRKMVAPELFDQVVMSFVEGVRKPKRAMFELAARRAGIDAENSILIDDLEPNCAGARAAGWQAIRYADNQQLFAEMAKLGV